jgi:hypothetical protein
MHCLLVWIPVLFACGKQGSSCPTVEELTRGSASDRRELEITVERCRADGWSATVTKCLRDANDEAAQENCFHSLSPEQQKQLKAALAPLAADDRLADQESADLVFQRKLDELHVEQLPTACADYRKAIAAARTALRACPKSWQLETYSVQQQVLEQLRGLQSIHDDKQLGAACTRHARDLRGLRELKCE